MKTRYLLIGIIVLSMGSGSCTCHDGAYGEPWELTEEFENEGDGAVDFDADDTGVDTSDTTDIGPDTSDTSDTLDTRDTEDVPDTEPEDPWEPIDVDPSVPFQNALTDRTSLAIDENGTFWLGFHTCDTRDCSDSTLAVARKPQGEEWTVEEIERHSGIFGLEIMEPERPVVVFTQDLDDSFKSATRLGEPSWAVRQFPVVRNGRGDGFDITHDEERFYVTFAGDGAPQVELFTRPQGASPDDWVRRDSLAVRDPQAAMERGFRADTNGSAYLVHRSDSQGTYGISRYDFGLDRWPQSEYLDEYDSIFVHSFYITDDFRLCQSGNFQDELVVMCGSMFDLTADSRHFRTEHLAPRHPSSIIEGDDGTLYVAYNPEGNDELRVARLRPGRSWTTGWETITVYDGPSYGVSTAIGLNGDLAISFYTCDDNDVCSLKLVVENPNSL